MSSLLLLATLVLSTATEPPPAETFDALGTGAIQDLIILGDNRPILLRLRIMIGDRAFRSLGAGQPFRFQFTAGAAQSSTDLLFDHLDRDKDRQLSRSELASIVGSLHRLDRDANELIDAEEILMASPPAAAMPMSTGRAPQDAEAVPLHAPDPEDSPVRSARILIKHYDRASNSRRDGKLSPEEFAIPAATFAAADKSGDGTLNSEEVRAYLTEAPRDALLDLQLSSAPNATPLLRMTAAEGIVLQRTAANLVRIDVDMVRLDLHIDDGSASSNTARSAFHERFTSADVNNDGCVDKGELAQDDGLQSPLAPIFTAVDADGDGKLYPKELDDFLETQGADARRRLTLFASDEGHALFGMLDVDRDQRLGAREVLETFSRLSACDRDDDGKVSPEEIPRHIPLTLIRGDLSALLVPPNDGTVVQASVAQPVNLPSIARPRAGPDWFRKMDRNGDGDVSRREFLGTHPQFDRLDLDRDGLLSPSEAGAITPKAL
jgi:Ca2+-binding EF-hand superfamily protein